MTSLAMYQRNLVLFFCSFIWAGTQNVIPQVFFMKNYPEQKTLLLALFLVTGTLSSIAGMRTSHIRAIGRLAGNRIVLGVLLGITAVCTLWLFGLRYLVLFFVLHIVMRYLSNLLYNVIETSFAVASSGSGRIHIHVQSVLVYQVLAIAGASLYFALCYSYTSVHIFVIVVLVSTAYLFSLKHLSSIHVADRPSSGHGPGLSRFERLFLAYYLIVLSLFVIFQGTLIYFLSDYYQFEDAKSKGGILLGVISIMAAMTIVAVTAVSRRDTTVMDQSALLPVRMNYIPLALFLGGFALLFIKLSSSFTYVVVNCVLLSIGAGIFLATTRSCASALSTLPNRPNILKIYNNLANYAVLLGFLILLAISPGLMHAAVSFSTALAVGMGSLFACAVCLAVLLAGTKRRRIELG